MRNICKFNTYNNVKCELFLLKCYAEISFEFENEFQNMFWTDTSVNGSEIVYFQRLKSNFVEMQNGLWMYDINTWNVRID